MNQVDCKNIFLKKSKNNKLYSLIIKSRCKQCKLQSIRNSNFIELSLSLQNCSSILECIDDLLKEEIMNGDNQYYCGRCEQKQNAKRTTKLTSLPPVLNLQLLRFVYDRNSGSKKKLSTKIKFSELLDLKKFISTDSSDAKEQQSTYHLGAILMHVGKSANSGHYMAQIKNFQKNEWFNFNDEIITKLKKKQQLGCTDEESDSKASQGTDEAKEPIVDLAFQKGAAKTFSTANAYLLVYYRADLLAEAPKEAEIAKLSNQSNIVNADNQMLEAWFQKLKTIKFDLNELQSNERESVSSIYNALWVNYNGSKTTKSTKSTNSNQIQKSDRKRTTKVILNRKL